MIKKILLFALSILVFFSVLNAVLGDSKKICDENYVLLHLKYSNGDFQILNKSIETGCYSKFIYSSKVSNYYKLIGKTEEVYKGSFDPSLLFTDNFVGEKMQGGVIKIKSGEFFLNVPYIKEVNKIQIYQDNKLKTEEQIYDAGSTSCRIK